SDLCEPVLSDMPAQTQAAVQGTARRGACSSEQLLHREAPWNQALLVGAIDRELEVVSIRFQPMRQAGRIAGGLLALNERAIHFIRRHLRDAVLHHHEVVELDAAVLFAPPLARLLRIADDGL